VKDWLFFCCEFGLLSGFKAFFHGINMEKICKYSTLMHLFPLRKTDQAA